MQWVREFVHHLAIEKKADVAANFSLFINNPEADSRISLLKVFKQGGDRGASGLNAAFPGVGMQGAWNKYLHAEPPLM